MAPQPKPPKVTSKPHSPLNSSTAEIPLTQRHDFSGIIRSTEADTAVQSSATTTSAPSRDTLPAVQIQDLINPAGDSRAPSFIEPGATGSIQHYEVPLQSRAQLPAVNAEGLRVYRGRIYAELQYTRTTTVMVGWDESSGAYRAMLAREALPSGPALHFDPDSRTWRVSELQLQAKPRQASRSQSDSALVYVDTRHYVWDEAATRHHGYVVMHRKMRLNDAVGPLVHHAFKDESGAFVSVEPSTSRIDQPAELLPAWTDRDIWDLYGLQGADIRRFRIEANNTGKKPQWAKVRPQRMQNVYLYDELRRWLGPNMDRDMFNNLLEHQGLTPAKWAEKLEAVTLHRSSPEPQTPAPRLQSPVTPKTPNTTPAYGHQNHYTWDFDRTNFHGYVEMQRKPDLDDSYGPLTQLAFRDGDALTVVKPTGYSIHKETALRPFWRDIDIWNLYRIEGREIALFRQEVALNLKPPTWVKQREYPSLRERSIEFLRLWTNHDSALKSSEQVIARFQPYNLSAQQLARLCGELLPTGQFKNLINDEVPSWVTTHQARTLMVTNSKIFDAFLPEIHAETIRLRNQGEGTSILKASLTEPFFQELLPLSGFKRNKHNYLYRTDTPAVFKVDERTPFELARPAAMLPRPVTVEGSTSDTPVSAMFSLKTAMNFANETPQPTAGVTSTPHAQQVMFCYLLDTRNVEVVAGQDNRAYNATRTNLSPTNGKTWFPSMKMEGHVSMSPIGFTSRRIWLVNSTMTRAATVEDVHSQALARPAGSSQNAADAIEARTKAGVINRNEYDALIDEVAKAGKRVIELPAGKDVFSNEITFPPELINL